MGLLLVHKHCLPLEGSGGLIQGFEGSTLCGCVTAMAEGYRAQGQGGSKEMYFYSCFQGTVLVQRLMSQERCKPPSNKSPSPKPRGLNRFPSTISTENVIVSQVGSNFFDTKAKGQHTHYLSVSTGAKRTEGAAESFWSHRTTEGENNILGNTANMQMFSDKLSLRLQQH